MSLPAPLPVSLTGPVLPAPTGRRVVLGPNWFTSVMGTGIVAVVLVPVLPRAAGLLWLVGAALLAVLVVSTALHATSYVDHPVQLHFYGAPAMALLTVGSGAVAVHGPTPLAVGFFASLWTLGTLLGVTTAVLVPRRTSGASLESVGPWWLMAVVPPTVSATTGAFLAPHVPAGGPRTAYVLLCYALLLLSIVGTVRVFGLLARRWRAHGAGPSSGVIAWLMVLGPLGQSVTAVHHLGLLAPAPVRALTPYYGWPVLLGALGWLGVVSLLVVRARPPFGLTWWALTFPVATVLTGAAALGLPVLPGVLTALVVTAWCVVALGTVRGILDGTLLR